MSCPGTALCVCGHRQVVHQLTERKPRVRTWCSHMDTAGACPCIRYEEVGHA